MDVGMIQTAVPLLVTFALKVLGAIVLWIVGRMLIRLAVRLLMRSLRYPVDQTVASYIGTATSVLLNIALIVAILGFFGVETTTFAALMAGIGVAIGAAWSGLLAHLAAGVFLLILRPFKAGDFISAGGIQGTVEEIGLFVTRFNTLDNVQTYVANSRVFSDTIQNFSANAYRRVDLVAQLHNAFDPATAVRLLKERLAKIPNVLTAPPPDVEILQFNPLGPRAGRAPLLQQRALLAGLLRHQPDDPRDVRPPASRPPSSRSSCAPTATNRPLPAPSGGCEGAPRRAG